MVVAVIGDVMLAVSARVSDPQAGKDEVVRRFRDLCRNAEKYKLSEK